MARENSVTTVSEDDREAGAYFPKAKDWLDVGRKRLRHQLKRLEARLLEQHAKRVSYPLETPDAWYVVGALGYRADRKSFDYCIRHGHLEPPAKQGKLLMWTRENLIDFAMQLERLRYWLIGRHNEKKTVWELQAEWDQNAPCRDLVLNKQIEHAGPDELLNLMVEAKGKNARNIRVYVSGYYHVRRWERDRPLDATDEELLQQLIEENNAKARDAVALTIKRRAEKENAK